MDHATLVFASVFPVPSLSHTTPTPVATPDLGHTAPGTSFGSPFTLHTVGAQHRAVKRNQAWSTATRFLTLPKNWHSGGKKGTRSAEVDEALIYLLVGDGKTENGDRGEQMLTEWYTNEARIHFAEHVRSELVSMWDEEVSLQKAWDVLEETQQLLEQVLDMYLQPLSDHILPFLQQDASNVTIRASRSAQVATVDGRAGAKWKLTRDIHAAFAYSVPHKRFSKTLSFVLYDAGCRLFRFHIRHDGIQSSTSPGDTAEVRDRMTKLLTGLEHVGIGGNTAQKALAHAMNKILDTYVTSHYAKVDWYSKKSVVPNLRAWVQDGFCPLVELVMECLRCESSDVEPVQLKQWQDMALNRLGTARVENLFDLVIIWNKSVGAILDLKEYLKLDGAKEHLRASFSGQIFRRLLHPGATTVYILNVYISIIRAFHMLEPKGVLLQSVARPIRKYLKGRDDTARIIISSLLVDVCSDQEQFLSSSDLSYEIASEMSKPFAYTDTADDESDWNDMNWQPLPHDASPEYKKSKVEDVIYFLLTLLDRDDFINELKNILGEHLLKCQDAEYRREIRLLELIKMRLGEDKMQACEVMLRDVLESKRINETIRAAAVSEETSTARVQTPSRQSARKSGTPNLALTNAGPPAASLNAQILSSFFWPILRDDAFLVPLEIKSLQEEFEKRFERIKGMRKLRWLNALGEISITLAFDDRTEDFAHLTPWQVSVIYAFQPQSGEDPPATNSTSGSRRRHKQSITRSAQQLEDMLQIDDALLHQALAFWIGKSVLRETSPQTYAVIESLSSTSSSDDAAAAAALEVAQVQAAQTTTVKSQADLLEERKNVYATFILAMLTNQGNLDVGRILMMMRVMVQGGFPFGADEVRGLLVEMEGQEEVVALGADVWGVRRT